MQRDASLSYSNRIKEHILRSEPERRCCKAAQLRGMCALAAINGDECRVSSEYEPAISRLIELYFACVNEPAYTTGCNGSICYFQARMAQEGSFCFDSGCGHCREAFLAGIFLASGHLCDPDAEYMLEFTSPRAIPPAARDLLGGSYKTLRRGSLHVLYCKDSAAIEDFLFAIGAQSFALELIDRKIERDIRNNINRVNNAELANISRQIEFAQRQIYQIQALLGADAFGSLPAALRDTARLRLDNPDLSLAQLGELHEPKVSKATLSRRLREIGRVYEGMNEAGHDKRMSK